MQGKGFSALIPVKTEAERRVKFGQLNRPQRLEGVSAMWNAINGMTGHGVIGPTLGLIWLVGLAIATYAWLTLPGHRHR